jgi:hypothetical protein
MNKTFAFLLILLSQVIVCKSQTFFSGQLSGGSFSWDSTQSPYIITGTLEIDSDASLNIGPGVIVMFKYNPDPENKTSLVVKGELWAIGTQEDPIIFTSDRDDTYGDHNGDGQATIPRPGDWGLIDFKYFTGLDPHTLNHTIVKYGGGSSNYGFYSWNQNLVPERRPMVAIRDDLDDFYEPVEINNSLLTHSLGIGIVAGRGRIQNSTISHCHHPKIGFVVNNHVDKLTSTN